MKVSEAKEKVCPFISGGERTIYMGTDDDGKDITTKALSVKNCVCGDCMAWEYTKTEEQLDYESCHVDTKRYMELQKQDNIVEVNLDENDVAYFDKVHKLESNEKEGYCKRLEND
jgi:hypothetical protein